MTTDQLVSGYMGKTFEISGTLLAHLLYAATLGCLVLLTMVWAVDSFARVPLAILFASLAIAMIVGLWRAKTGRDGEHLGTAGDIVYDPLAPGQMAKERWLKSVRRLSGMEDEEDEED
ncbi:hypothetical protein ELS19_18435 [Halogeometricum borinquense]|uniref:Uncharacterized protein n=1 Tax=Halogeometricum borinquense TaxID=60847 RepID=A0A482T316_9EURY|nr:hypothetical protein [Halogeometricum borinquense]RYJ08502.1 hypothetical protein ELS19_18435 [Halogeometricum borinquense]